MSIKYTYRLESSRQNGRHYCWTVASTTPSLRKYEREVFQGKVPCPFKVTFTSPSGATRTTPIPLLPNGKPKEPIFS